MELFEKLGPMTCPISEKLRPIWVPKWSHKYLGTLLTINSLLVLENLCMYLTAGESLGVSIFLSLSLSVSGGFWMRACFWLFLTVFSDMSIGRVGKLVYVRGCQQIELSAPFGGYD